MKLIDVYPLYPITIHKGLGSYVWDEQGVQYLDMYGGHAVISIGHTHPHYVKRIVEQLQLLGFYSNSIKIPIQEELATKLGQISGKTDYQLFLCNSGAEANENALKLASFHNGRKKVVAFSKSFHGRTSLAVAATDNPTIVAPVNATDNVVFLPFNNVEKLIQYFKVYGHEVSSVIVEGIQGVGGINVASHEFLQAIRALCHEYGAVYIADSVQCGYGRTGLFFAHDHAGTNADIYTMAKGMGNGFPVAGIIASPIFAAKHGMLGTTFGGNHLACAAALAVLEVIENQNLMGNAATMGDYIISQVKDLPHIAEVRGKGLMIGIELDRPADAVSSALLNKHKIFTGKSSNKNTIRLLPSLALHQSDADIFLQAFRQVVSDLDT
ncbi:MAG: aminotransferase class III-fold pyridoxal phosphate-dependent enzyme [Cytophagales bacterium]|nr:aminotransferase class III-fold pyridoxal phosphate-dependent enzyme [Cytophagales bacterium]